MSYNVNGFLTALLGRKFGQYYMEFLIFSGTLVGLGGLAPRNFFLNYNDMRWGAQNFNEILGILWSENAPFSVVIQKIFSGGQAPQTPPQKKFLRPPTTPPPTETPSCAPAQKTKGYRLRLK